MKRDILTKKTLLSWLILHRVFVGEGNQDMSTTIPRYISLYKCSSTTRSKISTLFKSLLYQEYVMPSYRHSQNPFTITMHGKEYLKSQCADWVETVLAHRSCVERAIKACQHSIDERSKPSLTELDYPFVGQYLEYKKVLPLLILLELKNETMRTVSNLQIQLLKRYGWVCSLPTLTRLIEDLVEAGDLSSWSEPNESSKRFYLNKELSLLDYQERALEELHRGKKRLQEIIDYFTRYQL